jgi:hypothetical protein
MHALVRLPNSILRLFQESAWVDIPGRGSTSGLRVGDRFGDVMVFDVIPAADPPEGKRRVGSPTYAVASGVCSETYALADIVLTVDDVVGERDRRLALGFDYDFGDARGVHRIGTTSADMLGWAEVTQFSQAALALGTPEATIQIVTDTGPATVTATEWQAILLAAGAHRQPIWAASFVLQASYPIPADYAADTHWPPA